MKIKGNKIFRNAMAIKHTLRQQHTCCNVKGRKNQKKEKESSGWALMNNLINHFDKEKHIGDIISSLEHLKSQNHYSNTTKA